MPVEEAGVEEVNLYDETALPESSDLPVPGLMSDEEAVAAPAE